MTDKPSGELSIVAHLCSNRWNSAICEFVISSIKSFEILKKKQVVFALKDSPLAKRVQKETKAILIEVGNFSPSALFFVHRILRKKGPQLVICYGGPETFLLLILGFFSRWRLWRFFGDAQRTQNLGKGIFLRWSFARMDALILPSKNLTSKVRAKFASSLASKIHHVQLGLSEKIFFPAIVDEIKEFSTKYGFVEPRSRILIFGRLDPVKGHAFAIAAFSKLLSLWEKNPHAISRPQLVIAGQEANVKAPDLQREIHKHAFIFKEDDVVFMTQRFQNPHVLMSLVQLGWIPSLGSELIARVTQEFLLCGTKVFLSNAGALTECLREKSFGEYYLNDVDSIEVVSGKLLSLLIDSVNEAPKLRLERSIAAAKEFSLETMAKSYSLLLE